MAKLSPPPTKHIFEDNRPVERPDTLGPSHQTPPASTQKPLPTGKGQGSNEVQDVHTWLVAALLRELRLSPAGPPIPTRHQPQTHPFPYPPPAATTRTPPPSAPAWGGCRAAPSVPAPASSCGAGSPHRFTYLFGTVNECLCPRNQCG